MVIRADHLCKEYKIQNRDADKKNGVLKSFFHREYKVIPALTDSPSDRQTVIERQRNGVDVNALRQTASLNFDIDYPEEQQANNVRLA